MDGGISGVLFVVLTSSVNHETGVTTQRLF